MGSSSFFSHNIFPLPCMACCRGNRLENGLAFPAMPGESTHADMRPTTTCCMTGSGIFSPKMSAESATTWCFTLISGSYQRRHTWYYAQLLGLMAVRTNWAVSDDAALSCTAENQTSCWKRPCVLIQSLFHIRFQMNVITVCVHVYPCLCACVCIGICAFMWVISPHMSVKHFILLCLSLFSNKWMLGQKLWGRFDYLFHG